MGALLKRAVDVHAAHKIDAWCDNGRSPYNVWRMNYIATDIARINRTGTTLSPRISQIYVHDLQTRGRTITKIILFWLRYPCYASRSVFAYIVTGRAYDKTPRLITEGERSMADLHGSRSAASCCCSWKSDLQGMLQMEHLRLRTRISFGTSI